MQQMRNVTEASDWRETVGRYLVCFNTAYRRMRFSTNGLTANLIRIWVHSSQTIFSA
jgi:hypothetical protein